MQICSCTMLMVSNVFQISLNSYSYSTILHHECTFKPSSFAASCSCKIYQVYTSPFFPVISSRTLKWRRELFANILSKMYKLLGKNSVYFKITYKIQYIFSIAKVHSTLYAYRLSHRIACLAENHEIAPLRLSVISNPIFIFI